MHQNKIIVTFEMHQNKIIKAPTYISRWHWHWLSLAAIGRHWLKKLTPTPIAKAKKSQISQDFCDFFLYHNSGGEGKGICYIT